MAENNAELLANAHELVSRASTPLPSGAKNTVEYKLSKGDLLIASVEAPPLWNEERKVLYARTLTFCLAPKIGVPLGSITVFYADDKIEEPLSVSVALYHTKEKGLRGNNEYVSPEIVWRRASAAIHELFPLPPIAEETQ